MAGTSTGSGKYSLEKVMAEVLELKATQKRYAKQYLDSKSSSAAGKISFISDNAEITIRTTDSANLEIQGQQLKKMEEAISRPETTVKEIARQTSENERAIDDLEQYSRRNCLILHGCGDIPKKKSSYTEFESYVVNKLNFRLGLSHRMTFDINTCHILPSRKKDTSPIIIKFVRRSVRNSIYSSKKNLKSEEENAEKLSITESLTKRRLALVEEARNAFGFRNVWTFYGNVYCFFKNKRQVIDDFGDINRLLDS